MKRAISAIALALSAASHAHAQTDLLAIPLSIDPPVSFEISEQRTKTRVSRGQTSETVNAVQGRLDVVSAGPSGFEANWTTVEVESGEVVIGGDEMARSLLVGVPIGFTMDENGAPNGLADWDGLRAQVFDVMRTLGVNELTTPEGERAMEAGERMIAAWTPAQAAQIFMADVSIMSLCHNTSLRLGEVVRSDITLPNMLGGPSLQGRAAYELLGVDDATRTARIVYTSELDPASASAAIAESLERILRETGQNADDVREQFANLRLAHNTRAECVVDLDTGVTRNVTHRVDISVTEGEQRSDTRVIAITRAP